MTPPDAAAAVPRILLIDDNTANLKVLSDSLQTCGYEILVARSGEAGLARAARTLPDVILLDVNMPGLDGFEVCRRFKAAEATRGIPVIFITVSDDLEAKVKGFAAGGIDYVTKPFHPEEVLARVRNHLELRRLHRALESRNDELQREIAEHRRTEAALRQSEERYRALYRRTPAMLHSIDAAGHLIDASDAWLETMGYTREEVLGRRSTDFLTEESRRRAQETILPEYFTTGTARDVPYSFVRKDGTPIDVLLSATSETDAEGRFLRSLTVLVDVTLRKQAEAALERRTAELEAANRFLDSVVGNLEELVAQRTAALREANERLLLDIAERQKAEAALRESEERYRRLVDLAPDGIIIHASGRVVFANPAAQRMAGVRSPDELLGRPVLDFVHPDFHEVVRQRMALVAAGGIMPLLEERFVGADGRELDVEVVGMPFVHRGEPAFQVVFRDITDRKRVEQAQKERTAAEAANRAKSLFLANMSHELRTPLNAILGFAELMSHDATFTARQRENLQVIRRSGEHLLALINDVLEMSRIEAGRVQLEEETLDLHRLLDDLRSLFALPASERGLRLSFERPAGVPQYVRSDETKLRQVLVNLIGNAVKFTERGGITVRVAPEPAGAGAPAAADAGQIRLGFEVHDTGPGIAADEVRAIFDPFVQASRGRRSPGGTGLGLAISRAFVRLMGGELEVESRPGQGSVFRFDLVCTPIRLEPAASGDSGWVVGLEPGQPPWRLLVVEDQPGNRALLLSLLQPVGFDVRVATDGEQALETWASWHPHLIWMDMSLPLLDGFEATRRIRAGEAGRRTRIVALTANAFEEDRQRAFEAGCDDFLSKPLQIGEIYDALVRHLGVRFVYAAAAGAVPDDPAAALAEPPALPGEWWNALRQAATVGQMDAMKRLVLDVRPQHQAFAEQLDAWIYNFEHEKLLQYIEHVFPDPGAAP